MRQPFVIGALAALLVAAPAAAQMADPTMPPVGCKPRPGDAAPAPAFSAKGPSVRKVLRDRMLEGAITQEQHDGWRAVYDEARRVRSRLKGGRRDELAAVVKNADRMAAGGLLTVTRMPAVFLTLQRNTEYWRSKPFPNPGGGGGGPCAVAGSAQRAHTSAARLTFPGSPIIFQWYPGQGLQIQPLANFGTANGYYSGCRPETPKPGQRCQSEKLRELLDALMAIASQRGGSTVWEYYFNFGGGSPPWVSGITQGTAIQALARGSQLLGNPVYLEAARSGLGIFEQRPPVGVRVPVDGGNHYLIYSFNSRLRVLNGFLQAVIGLHDFAEISGDPRARSLFEAGDAAARREVPRFDTGAWSLYSQAGRESDLGYHRLVRDFLDGLCTRVQAEIYCGTAKRFTGYLSENPRLEFLGAAGKARAKRAVRLRFRLSKVSCVRVNVTRGGRGAFAARTAFGHGTRAFSWTPRAPGRYSIRIEASDLRNHHAVAGGTVTVRRR
jgi:D-glucuronyl C5-epimerase C-terminus